MYRYSWAYFFLALRLEGVGEPRAAPKPRATLEPRAKTLLAQDDEMNDMPKKKKKEKKTTRKEKNQQLHRIEAQKTEDQHATSRESNPPHK